MAFSTQTALGVLEAAVQVDRPPPTSNETSHFGSQAGPPALELSSSSWQCASCLRLQAEKRPVCSCGTPRRAHQVVLSGSLSSPKAIARWELKGRQQGRGRSVPPPLKPVAWLPPSSKQPVSPPVALPPGFPPLPRQGTGAESRDRTAIAAVAAVALATAAAAVLGHQEQGSAVEWGQDPWPPDAVSDTESGESSSSDCTRLVCPNCGNKLYGCEVSDAIVIPFLCGCVEWSSETVPEGG